MNNILTRYKNWRYKNTFFLFLSLLFIFYFSNTKLGNLAIHSITSLGYIGAFLAGIFFVSMFTVVPASIILLNFTENFNPILISVIAGLGAMFGDFIIFKYLKDRVFDELKPIFKKFRANHFSKNIPYFEWFAPVLGAIIIASPLPDELGVGLMGISKLKNWQFLIISFVLNSLGILLIIEFHKLA